MLIVIIVTVIIIVVIIVIIVIIMVIMVIIKGRQEFSVRKTHQNESILIKISSI